MAGSTLASAARKQIDLAVEGMTCASCVSRVERKLTKLDNVFASVNLATATAHVEYPPSVTPAQLIEAVSAAGYIAQVAPSAAQSDPPDDSAPSSEERSVLDLRQRLLGSLLLGAPVIVVSMAPVLQFTYWQWFAFALATPVALWGGWPFHRSAAVNLRHGATTMDTLVSIGVLTSWAWSTYALLFGGAGEPGMRMMFSFFAASQHGPELYLEVATALVIFILAGRYAEARSRRRAGEAIRTLAGIGTREASLLRNGREERIPIDRLRVGDEFIVRPGEKVATDGAVIAGSSAIDESLLSGESLPVEVGVRLRVTGASATAVDASWCGRLGSATRPRWPT